MTDQFTDRAATERSEVLGLAGPPVTAAEGLLDGPAWDRATTDKRANIVVLSGWRGGLGGTPAALLGSGWGGAGAE